MNEMPSRFRGHVHRGTQQIGGTCVELKAGGEWILPFLPNFFASNLSYELVSWRSDGDSNPSCEIYLHFLLHHQRFYSSP